MRRLKTISTFIATQMQWDNGYVRLKMFLLLFQSTKWKFKSVIVAGVGYSLNTKQSGHVVVVVAVEHVLGCNAMAFRHSHVPTKIQLITSSKKSSATSRLSQVSLAPTLTLSLSLSHVAYLSWLAKPWNSLVEDVQQDLPNSQTCMECCHACAAYYFWFDINTTAYHFSQYSLHILLLNSCEANLCGLLFTIEYSLSLFYCTVFNTVTVSLYLLIMLKKCSFAIVVYILFSTSVHVLSLYVFLE